MLKILLIAPTFGVPKDNKVQAMMSAYKSAHYLSKRAHVIVLTASSQSGYERVHDHLEIYRLPNIFLKDPINYVIIPSIFWQTIRLMYREKPDVYLVNKFMFFNAFVIPLLKLFGQRVYTQIDCFPSIDWQSRTRWIRPLMWIYMHFIGLPLLWLSDYVILFHEGLMPIAQKFRLKYKVIHNGVNFGEFLGVETAPEVKKKSPASVHIGYIGRLESMKGYDILLQACHQLLPDYPHVKLFMVGNTLGKEAILAQYKHPQIQFLGVRSDVPAILQGLDIFVLPSFSEGLSNSLMEAMAAGCAVVATDTASGNRVLIKPDQTGILAKPGSVSHLEAKIRALIEDPDKRHRLGQTAQKYIKERFNWETIAGEYMELFQKDLSSLK